MEKIWLQLKVFYFKYEWQVLLTGMAIVILIIFFALTNTSKNEIKIDKLKDDKTIIKERIKHLEDSLSQINKPILDSYVSTIKQQDAQIRILKEQREVYYYNWKVAEGKIKRMTVSDMQKRFDSLYPSFK